MHARHRNWPGNGHWSNAMGIRGQASASRISPEGSVRGQRYYSDYRNNKHGGFGRGRLRQFQSSMPPSRGTDIFMEAGRLAAEYLVSKGVLPSNALAGKWRNDGLKNQMDEFKGFKPHDVDSPQFSIDDHVSVQTRSENTSLDVGPARRRYSNDNNSLGSRNSLRERRRTGFFKNVGSEVNRELWKRDSWGDRNAAIPCTKADNDASVGHCDEQPPVIDTDGDGVTQTLSPGELPQERDAGGHPEFELEKHKSADATGTEASFCDNETCLPSDLKGESTKESGCANKSNADVEVASEGKNDAVEKLDENVQATTTAHENAPSANKSNVDVEVANEGKNDAVEKLDENVQATATAHENASRMGILDLVKQCKFAYVPTKPRTSLAIKGSKGDQAPVKKDEKIAEKVFSVASVVHVIDSPDESLAGSTSTHQIHGVNNFDSDVVKAPALDREVEVTHMTRPGQCSRSRFFPEISVCKEGDGEVDDRLSAFGQSNSMFFDRGGKRAMGDNTDDRESVKKHREWAPMDPEPDECMTLSSPMDIQPSSEGARTSQFIQATPSSGQKSVNISLFPKNHDELCEFMEEKPLFPGSFKTCDLNLIGTCDALENHDGERIFIFPSVNQSVKDLTHIDVGLSMNNSCNMPDKNAKFRVNNNNVEVIDLENDSAHEDQSFSYPERRPDSLFTDLDGFPNNVNEIPDAQDGYGLMLSELLGNDSPNCSTMPTDLSSLHHAIGLSSAEGILGDDDSIYMTLGEIPISFLHNWEPPAQNYGKPF